MSKIILFANTDWYLYNFRRSLALAAQAAGKVGGNPLHNPATLPVPQDPAEPNIDAEFNAAIPTATAPQPATPEVRQ